MGGTPVVAHRVPLPVRPALVLFGVVLVVHGLSPDVQVADSRLSVPTAYAIVHSGSLTLDDVPSVPAALDVTTYDVVEREDKLLPFFPWPPMLFAVPGVLAAEAIGVDVGEMRPSEPTQTWKIEQPIAALLVALTTVVMALVALELVGPHPRAVPVAMGTALAFAFGTAAWSTASRALWQHTPAMLCAALALLAAVAARRGSRWLWLLGAALAAGFTMRPTAAVPLVAIGIWSVLEHRREAWRVVVAGALVAVPFLVVNLVAYGDLLPPYYAGNRLGNEQAIGFAEAFFAHLVSPSRGLLVYTPMFLLIPVGVWLARRGAWWSLTIAVSLAMVGHSLVVGYYGSTGGSSYGSRFYTEVAPYLLFLCLPLVVRALDPRSVPRWATTSAVGLVALSVLMAVPGAASRSAFCWSASPEHVDEAPERIWDWSDPQFLRPARRVLDGYPVRDVLIGSCTEA